MKVSQGLAEERHEEIVRRSLAGKFQESLTTTCRVHNPEHIRWAISRLSHSTFDLSIPFLPVVKFDPECQLTRDEQLCIKFPFRLDLRSSPAFVNLCSEEQPRDCVFMFELRNRHSKPSPEILEPTAYFDESDATDLTAPFEYSQTFECFGDIWIKP